MYQPTFGKVNQLKFSNEPEYYETLGYLAKSSFETEIKWERNKDSGAWENEGRIEFFVNKNTLPTSCYFKHTAGNGAKVLSRVNCNTFVRNIVDNHLFLFGPNQDANNIRNTIPAQYQADFDRGLAL